MLYLITDINFNKTAAKIFNSQGQLVSTILLNGSGTISIPVSQLKPGTYFFKYSTALVTQNLSLLKIKSLFYFLAEDFCSRSIERLFL